MNALEREEVDFVLYTVGSQYPGIERFENAYPRLHRYLVTRFEVDHIFQGPLETYAELRRRKPAVVSASIERN